MNVADFVSVISALYESVRWSVQSLSTLH